MKEELLKYLKQFMLQSNWDYENTPKQARALFTTLCLIGNIDADTRECDEILYALYAESDISELDIAYGDFENFMLELIV